MDETFSPEQELLMRIRKDYCDDVSAELARRIGKDVTYVNRLFYPIGKKGRKGIGLEVMRSCTTAFNLPAGFWEGRDSPAEPKRGAHLLAITDDEQDVLDHFREMDDKDRAELAAEIAKRAERWRAYRQRLMQELGLPAGRSASAHARTKQVIAKTSVEGRQRQLDLDEAKRPK